MERSYGSLVRHELGSYYSALDGVPFKIGRAFRKPEQIRAPQISSSNVAQVLSQEYSYDTEEGVLAWARARDEAARKAAEEQAERLQLAERERLRGQVHDEEICDSVKGEAASSSNNVEETSYYDVPKSSVAGQEDKPPVPPKPDGAKALSESGGVLLPIPAKRTRIVSKGKGSKSSADGDTKLDSQLDLAMFEAEEDPFDNIELQTINDMEELKVLLNSNSLSATNQQPFIQNGSQAVLDDNSVDEINSKSEVTTSNLEAHQPASNGGISKSGGEESCTSVNKTLPSVCDEGEYVEIDEVRNVQQQSCHHNVSYTAGDDKTTAVSNGLPMNKPNVETFEPSVGPSMNSQIYKPVLPPISKQQGSECNHSQQWNSPLQSPKVLPVKQQNGRMFASQSPPPTAAKNDAPKPFRPAPPPPVGAKPALRSRPTPSPPTTSMTMSTGPSLSNFLSDSGSTDGHVKNNPYSRHCISQEDLISDSPKNVDSSRRNSAASSPQLWNRHTPLPPLPGNSNSSFSHSCLPSNPQPQGLSDPYLMLSREEQTFTNSLTNMGFLRPRVARAVQKFGAREKEVLDHLLAVDKLGEQNFAPLMIESALYTFKNDPEKAERFLHLHAQFEELGFQRDKIHDALVSTDLHHDKALDILTA